MVSNNNFPVTNPASSNMAGLNFAGRLLQPQPIEDGRLYLFRNFPSTKMSFDRIRGGQSSKLDESDFVHRDQVKSELIEILPMLLLPNSTMIKSAEGRLNVLVSNPCFVEVMLDIILNRQNPLSIRQLASTVVRRKIGHAWDHIDPAEQDSLQEHFVQAMLTEPAPEVRRQLALCFGEVAKLANTFAQLDRMVRRVAAACRSEEPACRELGLEVLQGVVEELCAELRSMLPDLVEICEAALTDPSVRPCPPRPRAPHAQPP